MSSESDESESESSSDESNAGAVSGRGVGEVNIVGASVPGGGGIIPNHNAGNNIIPSGAEGGAGSSGNGPSGALGGSGGVGVGGASSGGLLPGVIMMSGLDLGRTNRPDAMNCENIVASHLFCKY